MVRCEQEQQEGTSGSSRWWTRRSDSRRRQETRGTSCLPAAVAHMSCWSRRPGRPAAASGDPVIPKQALSVHVHCAGTDATCWLVHRSLCGLAMLGVLGSRVAAQGVVSICLSCWPVGIMHERDLTHLIAVLAGRHRSFRLALPYPGRRIDSTDSVLHAAACPSGKRVQVCRCGNARPSSTTSLLQIKLHLEARSGAGVRTVITGPAVGGSPQTSSFL